MILQNVRMIDKSYGWIWLKNLRYNALGIASKFYLDFVISLNFYF